MKLPDCASNVDVKNVRVRPNRIILRGVMTRQRGADIKTTLYIYLKSKIWLNNFSGKEYFAHCI